MIAIVELDADDVLAHVDALGSLLLDAHASGMALGLAAPLTAEAARAAYVETAARLAPGERVLLAAVDGDAPVGAVQLDRAGGNGRHRAELRRLVVRAERRGEGIGRLLMDAAVDHARSMGLTLLWLSTHAGTSAERVYERLGWTLTGVVPGWAVLPDGSRSANSFWHLEL